jgi:hypothetical protein
MSCKKEQAITEVTDFCNAISRDETTTLSHELENVA